MTAMVFVKPFHDFSSAKHGKSFVTEMTISQIVFYKKIAIFFHADNTVWIHVREEKETSYKKDLTFKKILVIQIMTFIVRF